VCRTQDCSSPELIRTIDRDEKLPSRAGIKRPHPFRKVAFSEERNETYETYSRDEIQDLWYSRSDYKAIQMDLRSTSQMISWGIPLNDCRRCRRGLERFDRNVFQASHARCIARRSVLEAQIQGKEAEEIASIYATHTRARSMRAYLQGIADERHVRVVDVSP